MKSRLNKEIGKRIRYLRKQRGLSQEKLAECLNIATTSLSYIGKYFVVLCQNEYGFKRYCKRGAYGNNRKSKH